VNEGSVFKNNEWSGTYGRDIGSSLPELLRRLADEVPSGCRLRLGMTNPPYILDHLPDIAQIMHHPRVYK
jgi:threonylcarbamoyladenosine tRNA methylthiotransferase CDKAL1